MDALVAQMYRAAADDRQWMALLGALEQRFDAQASWLVLFQGAGCMGAHATAGLREVAAAGLAQTRHWAHNPQLAYGRRKPPNRFMLREHYFPAQVLAEDEVAQLLLRRQLHHQAGTVVPLAHGTALLGLSRPPSRPFGAPEMRQLNRLHAHLAQAVQLAAHVGLRGTRQATDLMQDLGQAAAVLSRQGAVLGCNALFEATVTDWAELDWRERPRAHDAAVSAQLDAWLAQPLDCATQAPLVRARSGALLRLRLLPLVDAGQERLLGGTALLVVEPVAPALPPDAAAALRRRHGLSDKEAQLAVCLADGVDLRDAAAALGLTYASARTYLDRIYGKTGVRRQVELARLVLAAGALAVPH